MLKEESDAITAVLGIEVPEDFSQLQSTKKSKARED